MPRKKVTKKKKSVVTSGPKPNNPGLYSRVKSMVKKKAKGFPSAYASAQIVREYKKRGGTYSGKKPR